MTTAVKTGVLTADAFIKRPPRSLWRDAFSRLIANRLAMLGLIFVLLLVLIAIFADVIAPYNPTLQQSGRNYLGPSPQHWLGTDSLGRDVLSRMIHGARVSMAVGIFTQFVYFAVGIPIGAIAAFVGGRTDNILMRFVDIIYAFPDLLLIILLRSVFGGGLFMIFLAIGLAHWTGIARLTRGQILSLREREYVVAARTIGVPGHLIVLRHLLPNSVGPLIVAATFGVPTAIFAEAALSYIGIGVPPPAPSWGTMVQDGYAAIFAFPHLVLFPALAVAVTMMAFTFLGDGLRDALDPRTRRTQ